jgi:carboxypeptidase PM20D1
MSTNSREIPSNPIRPRSPVKGGLAILAAGIVGLVAVLGFNTLATRSKQIRVDPVAPRTPLPGYAERLGHAIRFPTIAVKPPRVTDPAPFDGLAAFLKAEFPTVHREIEREVIGGHTLLYRWKGTSPSMEPILIMSHLDVVPVEEGTEESWTYPPFSGAIADGFIWGRGALDVKCGALGLLEAAESLLREGFQPSGDVYFALGHDEETGGVEGNLRVAELLRSRGVRFRFVLDEGGGLTEGIIDGVEVPVAFVGIAAKGMATVKLKGRGEGGHASMPPPQTVIGRVAAGVARLEANPFPARIEGATAAMLDYLGPEMPWPRRVALDVDREVAQFDLRGQAGGLHAWKGLERPRGRDRARAEFPEAVVGNGRLGRWPDDRRPRADRHPVRLACRHCGRVERQRHRRRRR